MKSLFGVLFVLCLISSGLVFAQTTVPTSNEFVPHVVKTRWGFRFKLYNVVVGQPGAQVKYWYTFSQEAGGRLQTDSLMETCAKVKTIGKYGVTTITLTFSVKPDHLVKGVVYWRVGTGAIRANRFHHTIKRLAKKPGPVILVAYQLGRYLRYRAYAPNRKHGEKLFLRYQLQWETGAGRVKTDKMMTGSWDVRSPNRWGDILHYGVIYVGSPVAFTFTLSAKIGSTGRVVTKTFN